MGVPGADPLPGEGGVVDQADLAEPVEHRRSRLGRHSLAGEGLSQLLAGPRAIREQAQADFPGDRGGIGVGLGQLGIRRVRAEPADARALGDGRAAAEPSARVDAVVGAVEPGAVGWAPSPADEPDAGPSVSVPCHGHDRGHQPADPARSDRPRRSRSSSPSVCDRVEADHPGQRPTPAAASRSSNPATGTHHRSRRRGSRSAPPGPARPREPAGPGRTRPSQA